MDDSILIAYSAKSRRPTKKLIDQYVKQNKAMQITPTIS